MTKKRLKTKLTTMGLSVALAATVLSGCGSSFSSRSGFGTTSKSQYTMYEALHNDDFKIWYSVRDDSMDKDSYPECMYLVENNTYAWITPDVKAELTFSELAKMTDEEIIQYCKEHPYTAENSRFYDSQEDVDKEWWVPKQLTFTAMTDGTGNNTAKEIAGADDESGLLISGKIDNNMRHFTVYDSEYYGMSDSTSSEYYLITRSDTPVSFVMDQPGAEGVEFD